MKGFKIHVIHLQTFLKPLMQYIISQASRADVPALCRLVNSAYRGDSSRKGWTTEAELIDGSRIDEETLLSDLENSAVSIFKATNNTSDIIACVLLKIEPAQLYLGMLTVSPLLQAKGIGKLLLEASEQHAKLSNKNRVKMTVLSARTELIAWYERHGYYKTGVVLPFQFDEKFGKPRIHLELLVLEKELS